MRVQYPSTPMPFNRKIDSNSLGPIDIQLASGQYGQNGATRLHLFPTSSTRFPVLQAKSAKLKLLNRGILYPAAQNNHHEVFHFKAEIAHQIVLQQSISAFPFTYSHHKSC